jgi:hypothetical protein
MVVLTQDTKTLFFFERQTYIVYVINRRVAYALS